jgi:hypothetical protein
MNKDDILGYAMIILILIISYKIYSESDLFQLKCIISDVNGETYCVRERKNITQAADLLAKTSEKMKELVEYTYKNNPNDERVQRLHKKFNPEKIVEILPTSEFTAYSENKGRKIAFCLNKKKDNDSNLIDENTLMFVAIHELAHVSSISIGHTEEFWTNFKFLLGEAKNAGIYMPIDYSKTNQEYCSMNITDNPYFS